MSQGPDPQDARPVAGRLSRRGLMTAAAAAGIGAATGRALRVPPGTDEAVADAAVGAPGAVLATASLGQRVPFAGRHQAGVVTPRPAHAVLVAFDVVAPGRPDAAQALVDLSTRARALAAGYRPQFANPGEGPTPDSGILGAVVPPDALTVTIGFGASFFDERFGLAAARPAGLRTMPAFPDDELVAGACHGDLLLQLCANTAETLLHALRDLMRATRGSLAPRWKVEGFLPVAREHGAGRNLLGFKDGTGNPATDDRMLMDRLVWTPAGGTFQVVRLIRNRVEFWDRVSLDEQERIVGRRKDTGAPLDGRHEGDEPEFAADPKGEAIPLDAHIRLARPRTAATESERILRRPFNYSQGLDLAGQLDMGLLFVSFQRDLHQFEAIQRRLSGEPLADYVVPTGGGYFYVPRGVGDDQDWIGSDFFV